AVARAIFDCRVPVISGVGHEIDTTIADMVADVRAATPTAAAELATPDREQLRRFCHQQAGRMRRGIGQRRAEGWAALRFVQRSEFFRNPLHRVRTMAQRFDEAVARLGAALPGGGVRAKAALDELHGRLRWCLSAAAKRKGDALAAQQASLAAVHPFQQVRLGRREVAAQQRHLIAMVRAVMTGAEGETERYRRTLEAMNYRNVLRRGYSVTRDARRRIIRCEADVGAGQTIHTELADGEIRSVVDGLPARGRGGKAGSECGPTLFEEPLT
ncbi:MAG: hypothetical protein HQ546_04445, partial [Planctomycetes bacterium]|nr:hypothetical protein [Planctomycetota bacterium]